ncbi:hypothetical protein HD554DRAFT_2041448 [Boletus coccyginus]|nr:hypothetical protein HD554DRAFT_2041448 [Boletus coccyginus]
MTSRSRMSLYFSLSRSYHSLRSATWNATKKHTDISVEGRVGESSRDRLSPPVNAGPPCGRVVAHCAGGAGTVPRLELLPLGPIPIPPPLGSYVSCFRALVVCDVSRIAVISLSEITYDSNQIKSEGGYCHRHRLGLNTWPNVHIDDIGNLYVVEYDTVLDGRASHGRDNLYFGENSEHVLKAISERSGSSSWV